MKFIQDLIYFIVELVKQFDHKKFVRVIFVTIISTISNSLDKIKNVTLGEIKKTYWYILQSINILSDTKKQNQITIAYDTARKR